MIFLSATVKDVNHYRSSTTLTPRPRCFRPGNESNCITSMLYEDI